MVTVQSALVDMNTNSANEVRVIPLGRQSATGMAGTGSHGRLLESLLFGVGAYDPLTFVSVPVGLAIVALVACWIPARRAARVDPIAALRFE